MKSKADDLRSCSGCLAWVFGILLALFVLNYVIDMARLLSAWNEAYALAAQLGYTPERHLTDRAPSDINIVPVFGACEVKVFFTTPLDPADFALRAERSGANRSLGNPTDGRNMYLQLPFDIDGVNRNMLSRDQIEELPPVYEQYWFGDNEKGQIKTAIFYSQFSRADVAIEYDDRPITENVAYVRVEAGIFPIWTFLTDICVRSRDLQQWIR